MNIKYLVALLSFGCCVAQERPKTVTVEDALVAAYLNNKEWSANQTDKRLAEEKYRQSKMMFLPDINAYMGMSRDKKEQTKSYYGNPHDYGSTRDTGTNFGLRLRQNLFNGFSTKNSMDASKFESNAAFHKLMVDEQKLIVKVLEAYTNVWFSIRKVDALKKKESNLLKTLSSQQSSLEVGVVTSSEVASANADYHKATFERISAETELFSAESEFRKLTGLDATKDIELPVLELDLPASLDKLIELALSSNNSIMYGKLNEQAALKALAAARGRLAPSCDLALQTAKNLSKTEGILNTGNKSYSASIEVNVPIFANGSQGNSYSQIEIANQQALKARFTAEDTLLEVKKECVVNWNVYLSTNAMIESCKTAVESEELSSDSNLEATALGLKSNTDIWVRENKLLESRINLADSQRRKVVAAVKLLMLTGNLNTRSLVSTIKKSNGNNTKKTIKQKYA